MLFDIRRLDWDAELCELLGVDPARLPQPLPSSCVFGTTTEFGGEVPVAGVAGDQQAALFGQACHQPGMAKNTYGTGSFVLLNSGPEPPPVPDGLLATVAWGLGEEVAYALEASIFVTGAAVQWLRDGLGIIAEAGETRGARRLARLQRRRLLRPRPDRARLAALGPLRARHDRRPHPRQRPRPPGAGGAGGDRLRDRRRGARPGGGLRRAARAAARRRRRHRQPLADAVPGRRARGAGLGAGDRRDDRPRRRLPGRDRDRRSGRSSRWGRCGARPTATSRGWRRRSARSCWPTGSGRWSVRADGRDEATGLQGPAPRRVLRPVPRARPARASAGPTRSPGSSSRSRRSCSSGCGRSGSKNVPKDGPLVLAPNHFSQMDHFFVGVYLRRKIRFMAKSQLFGPPVLTYIYKHGGVFPVRRGHHDEEAFETARTLARPGRDAARLRRGRPLPLAASWASRNRASAGSRWNPGRRSSRSRSTAPSGSAVEAAALPQGHGPVRRAALASRSRRRRAASASSRSRPRSSPGCGRCTKGWLLVALLDPGVEVRIVARA